MTCNKVINLESLRSKKKSDISLSEHNNSSAKKITLQQSQEDEIREKSQTPELVMPPPSGEQPLLEQDQKNELEIAPVTQQLVRSVTCGADSENVETKSPAPEVNEHLRPLVTSAPYASGKYVCLWR